MNEAGARIAALCRRFAESADHQAAALRLALKTGDRERAAEVSHHLAGASGIFGQPALGKKASRLEAAIDAQADDAEVTRLADLLLAALDNLAQGH